MGKINIYNGEEWIGKKYCKLTVLEPVQIMQSSGTHAWYWRCKCDCGNERIVRPRDLIVGKVKSCGCKKAADTSKRRRVHGENKTRLHGIWVAMRYRCNNKNDSKYGGRGISVCDEWNDYVVFREWALSHGYSEELTIDRIDVNGNYCPDNCRWVSLADQAINRRNNRKFTINGETHALSEWCKIYNVSYYAIHNRVSNGWDVVSALTVPVEEGSNQYSYYTGLKGYRRFEYNGKMMKLSDVAKIAGVKYQTLYKWAVREGLSLDEALKKCPKHPLSSKNT